MKILLINPPSQNAIGSIMPKALEEGLDFLPPLGLMYLAALIKKETPHEVKVLDAQVEQLTYDDLKTEIKKYDPDIIGATAMTFTIFDVIKTIKAAKEAKPTVKVILGGPHPTIFPEESINLPGVDFVIVGEAEKIIKPLLENLVNPAELKKVKGIVFRENGQLINNGKADYLENLDELPFPARELVPYKKYFSVVSYRRPVTTMFTSRGCPYQCLFCDRPQMGKNFRARSAKNVVDEMAECEKLGIKEIFIYDDTFAADRQRVLDICAKIKERGLTIAWDIRTRVNTVDEELLRAIKAAGCQRIHYGVEAGTQKILNVLRKGITVEQVEKAFALTKKIGIQTAGYFMIGSPTETREDILATIKLIRKIDPEYVHISITTPFPATDLYRLALEQKVIASDCWKEFAQNPQSNFLPPLWEKELSRQELSALLKKAYRSFYLRPGYILKRLRQIKSPAELFQKAKAALRMITM